MEFLKRAAYIRYVIAKLSKFVQISMQTSSDSFLQRILSKLNQKRPRTSVIEFFNEEFSFVILHKLVKFHYQTVFTSHTSQGIQ